LKTGREEGDTPGIPSESIRSSAVDVGDGSVLLWMEILGIALGGIASIRLSTFPTGGETLAATGLSDT